MIIVKRNLKYIGQKIKETTFFLYLLIDITQKITRAICIGSRIPKVRNLMIEYIKKSTFITLGYINKQYRKEEIINTERDLAQPLLC